jgi:hypothetical protein
MWRDSYTILSSNDNPWRTRWYSDFPEHALCENDTFWKDSSIYMNILNVIKLTYVILDAA